MINIKRQRWIIVRDGQEVYCGTAKNYYFKPIEDIGNTAIKTYMSKAVAIASFNASWHDDYDDDHIKIVPITERIREVEVKKRDYINFI